MQTSNHLDSMLNIGRTRYVYTDGGCHNEQGPKHGMGSWAFLEPVDLSQGYVDVYGGYITNTTNNATEMLAVINGVRHIDDTSIESHPNIHVVSDSEYVVKGYNDPAYLDRWVAKGWRTSSNKPVLNRDLWERILSLSWHIGLEFELIRGHSHDNNHIHAFWNNICDKSCTFIMDNLQYSGYRYNLRYDFDTRKILLSSQMIWEA